MAFPSDFLDEIRARLPISQVVGRRVEWDRRKSIPARGDYWACCPFHGEKTPSFHADDRRGRYHCFGCGVSGDIFTFLTESDGLSFPEAVERLAADAGVAMPARDPEAQARDKRRAGIHEVVEAACRFFEANLAGEAGGAARAYLKRRGFGPDIQKRFRLGLALPSRNALKTHLASLGITAEQMAEAGLIVTGDDIPVSYDRFRERVIFPIADLRDRLVGFGGRALRDGQEPKYLNSPETPVFQKGHLLYNATAARAASRQAGTVVAVEGYADVIALAAVGIEHVVAPLGTALTERQLEILWRMAEEPILCFDGDSAGQRAAARAAGLALPGLKPGRSIRFAFLPEGRDPDDMVREAGKAGMEQVLAAAEPLVAMLWTRETEGQRFDTPERRAALEATLARLTREIAEPSVRKHYEQAFAERLAGFFGAAEPRRGYQPDARRDYGAARRRNDSFRRPGPPPVSDRLKRSLTGRGQPPLREIMLVMTMVGHPLLLAEYTDEFAELELTHPDLVELRRELLGHAAESVGIEAADLRRILESGRFGPLLARLDAQLKALNCWTAHPEAAEVDAAEAWRQAAILHRKAGTLHKELRDAEAALAAEPSEANLARLVDIQAELASSDGIAALIEGFGASSGRRATGI